jgi:uncharacterized membrane protein
MTKMVFNYTLSEGNENYMPTDIEEPKNIEGKEYNHPIELKNRDEVIYRLERQYPLSEAEYLKIILSKNFFYYGAGTIIVALLPVGLEILTKYPDFEKWMVKYIFWGTILSLVLFVLGLLSPKRKRKTMKKIDKYFNDAEKSK